MKDIEKTNSYDGNPHGMTLADYYQNIPSFPKRDFVRDVMARCEVNENTVYNWVSNRSKPQKNSYYRILSEMTGIAPEKLFAD